MTDGVLVLGGAGFVGSALAIGLRETFPTLQVICCDNLRRRGSELSLSRLRHRNIRFVHGDVRNSSDLDPASLGRPRTVIDCSAEPSVLAGVTSPNYLLQTNLLGTINTLEFCRHVGAKLLFLSTSRVYSIPALVGIRLDEEASRFRIARKQSQPGITEAGISEDFSIGGFRSLYGTSKLASEMLIEEYRQAFGLKAIVNRCGVLTGPWQMGKVDQGVFVLWMAAHYFGSKLQYIGYGGSGKQVRDLLHIDDLIQLVAKQIEYFDDLDGETFNIGGGAEFSLSLLETTALCRQITGHSVEITSTEQARPADVPLFITDNAKVISRMGWRPQRSPRRTLQDIYGWITENEKLLRPILS